MNPTEGGARRPASYRPHGALDPTGMLVRSAGSSMDRASDYGSEGWGFDSLPARYQGKHPTTLSHTGSTVYNVVP